jgi:hypothetical protein
LGSTVDAATAALNQLAARVTGTPLPTSGNRSLGPGFFFNGLVYPLYFPPASGWPALRTALASALQGDGGPLLSLSDQFTGRGPDGYTNEFEANMAINCVDNPAPTTVARVEQDAVEFARSAPFFGAALAWSSLPCTFWPVPPTDSAYPVSAPGAPRLLVVGNTRDPATPYAGAQDMARQLRAVLLTFNADGHTAYGRSTCIDSAVDSYLITLTLPPAGTVCPS